MSTAAEGVGDSFRDGIRLFNEEYFFEAHEHLEGLWRVEHGEARPVLQGLSQICGAFSHLQNGNLVGAVHLLEPGAGQVRAVPRRYMGIYAGTVVGPAGGARPEV